MSSPYQHVPAEIVPELASAIKPYVLLIYKKGPNYNSPDKQKIIQGEHLPYVFDLRHRGIMSMAIPVMEPESEVAAIGIYNITDKEEITRFVQQDPGVQKGLFTYELLNCMGMKGDTLG